ncbi:3-keto-5-aminohexanoate cleavage protein [Paracoccus sp. SJTW-4]|uniref:3-keto-5-aminohexanoate cleavage protein n=1 Tax=Paracoccus sp. SJTW-4 TaxID=3078428 RepID=UPI0039ECE732
MSHLYTLPRFADRGCVKLPFLARNVFGIRGGMGMDPEKPMHMNAPADRLSGADDHPPAPAAGRHRTRLVPAGSGGVRAGLPARTRRSLEELGLQRATAPRTRAILQAKGGDDAAF